MNSFTVTGKVQRFPGKYGWYYVELDHVLSKDLRPLLKDRWPSLLNAQFTLKSTKWNSSIMPIKEGPLFIALPAKIRKQENIVIDQMITIEVTINP